MGSRTSGRRMDRQPGTLKPERGYKMPVNEIGNLCFKMRLSGRYEQDVTAFCQKQGEEATLGILRKIHKERGYQEAQGMRLSGAVGLWKQYSADYVKSASGRKRERQQKADMAQQQAAYEETKSSGYQPTREAIKNQLDGLMDVGAISPAAYEWGMVGLDHIHGMVAEGQEALRVAATQEEIPF